MTKINKVIVLIVLFVVALVIGAGIRAVFFNEKAILGSLPPDATDEEKLAYIEAASSQAEEAEYLDITNCESNPTVFKVKDEANFKVRNAGDTDRRVRFFEQEIVTVPAGSVVEFTALFGSEPGTYGYGCDLSNGKPAGIIVTTE